MSSDVREQLGKLMHESWSKTKRAQGFHGPDEQCTAPRAGLRACVRGLVGIGYDANPDKMSCVHFHPDLIPWEQLPEKQKDINRHAFDAVLEQFDLVPKGVLQAASNKP